MKDLSAAATAHVPIMSFSLDGVEFDALFAQLPLPSVKVSPWFGLCVSICIHTYYIIFWLCVYAYIYIYI